MVGFINEKVDPTILTLHFICKERGVSVKASIQSNLSMLFFWTMQTFSENWYNFLRLLDWNPSILHSNVVHCCGIYRLKFYPCAETEVDVGWGTDGNHLLLAVLELQNDYRKELSKFSDMQLWFGMAFKRRDVLKFFNAKCSTQGQVLHRKDCIQFSERVERNTWTASWTAL